MIVEISMCNMSLLIQISPICISALKYDLMLQQVKQLIKTDKKTLLKIESESQKGKERAKKEAQG